ncbi:hypothetical protein ACMFMG_001230 [Clarireedia jacksonii]
MQFTKAVFIITSLFWATSSALPIDSTSSLDIRTPKGGNGVSTAGDIVGNVADGLRGPAAEIVGNVADGLKAGGGKGAGGAAGAGKATAGKAGKGTN